ncbi:hypothetical protein HPB49_017920 [Dermacentor silvarum]|uniref:Uncharacterized protein n=1 Tax=Dermacentor silvarum TaxID=543639 RepID=A0ACB8DJY4_DERSI|nr:hypothetical protein HPB49_017920 [Dermacentor silvarum]
MDVLTEQPVLSYYGGSKEAHFNPYSDNGGSIVAVAGEDFAVIASDSRLTSGYQIHTREQSKLFKLSNQCVLGSTGCWCDILTFTRFLETRMKIGFKNMENVTPEPPNRERAVNIIKDVFISAAERDIYTGDSVIINIIDKNGIKEEQLALRRD